MIHLVIGRIFIDFIFADSAFHLINYLLSTFSLLNKY